MLGLGLSLARPWPASSAVGARAAPVLVALYGDSFGQRSQDILGSPNLIDAGPVDPQLGKWATDLTDRVGGVQWGFAAWLDAVSGGRVAVPYQLNRAIGGFNTGQLARFASPDNTPYYLADFVAWLDGMLAGPLAPGAVLFQAGTNDGVTTFSAASSYANVLKICQEITARGLPVVLSTVLPRGNAANPASRLTGARVTVMLEYNALLVANLAAEPSLGGRVTVVDPTAAFQDPAGGAMPFDLAPALEYDGLHLSAEGCRLLALAYRDALAARFPGAMAGHLPGPGGPACYNANPLMAGTGGTVTRAGNATTNVGFTIAGAAPDGWTVTTAVNTGGASAWSGTDPTNVKGSVTVAKAAVDEGEAVVVTLDCDAAGNTNANTRAVEIWTGVTLPDLATLPVGAYYRGIAVVEVARRAALPIAGFRGVSAELRVTEPDGILRTARSNGPAPNGTARMGLADRTYGGVDRIVLQTPPRIRKAGAYGTCTFSVFVTVAGQAPDIDAVVSVSRAGVVRST